MPNPHGRPRTPLAFRFAQKWVENKDTGCWDWTANKNHKGYGLIGPGGPAQNQVAHRVSYELHVGPIPKGMVLDHLCRNRGCVNPAHLEIVTPYENSMRGFGVAALNARKTHCPRGHPLSGENLFKQHGGGRGCRQCRRDFMRDYMRARRASQRVARERPD